MNLIHNYKIEPSEKKNKKLKVWYNRKWIHFGDKRYYHYFDKTGYYPSLNHNDEERRKRYLARAKKITNSNGEYTWKDKNSPNYWSVHLLW